METSYPKDLIKQLIEGKLEWSTLKNIISSDKDADRFDKYLDVLQDRVKWKEKILMPLTEHLYIVEKDKKRIVKCDCGYEFGDYRVNWKLGSLIHVRETKEDLEELWPGDGTPDPQLSSVREYYCPGCAAMLDVECVPVGYPAIFNFLPDLGAFYGEWLGRPLSEQEEYEDLSYDTIKTWPAED